MDQQAQLALIETYLVDETKMYQDWYKGLQQGQSESSMIPFAAELPLNESIIKRLQVWFDEYKDFLITEICIKWEYQRKKSESKSRKFFISALADALALLGIPSALAGSCWLEVKGYLDHICAECSKE
jgi:hypothetical protein